MAGADRLNKGEVLEVVEEDGGGHIKNFSLYPRSSGKPFVSFTVLKTITKNVCVVHLSVYFFVVVVVGSPLSLGQGPCLSCISLYSQYLHSRESARQ